MKTIKVIDLSIGDLVIWDDLSQALITSIDRTLFGNFKYTVFECFFVNDDVSRMNKFTYSSFAEINIVNG